MGSRSRSAEPDPVDVGRPATSTAIGEGRSATPEETYAAETLGMRCTWYAMWVDAAFDHDEIAAWYPLTTYRSVGPAAALALQKAQVSPTQFLTAIQVAVACPPANSETIHANDAIGAANEAVLMQEVAEFLRWRATTVIFDRDDALVRAREFGAATVELANRLGWSKQRIDQLARSKPRSPCR